MKKELDPKLVIAIIGVFAVLAAVFLWRTWQTGGGTAVDDSKYMKVPPGHHEGGAMPSGGANRPSGP